ncbi:MAG TPA: hypothetical protein VFB43_03240 [Terracidiphilus sp.]|nr:hypothetical protein [Terracidiphilus sp.]
MRHKWILGSGGVATWLLLSTVALAGKWSATDFPLRVHIFGHSGVSHYHNQFLDGVDGEGRANLFENGQPRGFDFGYRCGERLRNSVGYETYVARWKKPGRQLEILMPVLGGKPGQMDSCDLEVTMKDGAYFMHNGSLNEEPQDKFKAWMEKHKYDPEHGLNEPVALEPAPAAPPTPAATAPAAP